MKEESYNNKEVIAAFDFDGTITYRDTTLAFLIFIAGYWKTFFLLLMKIPIIVAYVLGISPRQQTKESIFGAFMKGKSLEDIRRLGEAFSKDFLPRHVRPQALERIQWHQKQGHRCLLVSASIDAYLEPWAKSVGMEDAVTSRLAVDENGNVTGKLQGLNCRREEKVRRLSELLGPLEHYHIYAYGDSDGDKELLEAADDSFYRFF